MHAAAHTSGQIGGISPSNKQLSATNEHMLLQFQLSHHNFYWPKSAVAFVRMTDAIYLVSQLSKFKYHSHTAKF